MNPIKVGNKVFIRTVTHYYTGQIVEVSDSEIVLDDAAWIADTGRWGWALEHGTLSEIEPFCDPVAINRASIVDMTIWRHALPREVK